MAWPVLPHGFLGTAAVTGDEDTYQVSRSLRFNDDDTAYLSRTWGTPTDAKKLTISLWYKRSNLGGLMSAYGGSVFCPNTQNLISVGGNAASGSDEIQILYSNAWMLISNGKYRDPASWYHLVVSFDSTQTTATNRCRVYLNNTEITSWSTDVRTNITQNSNLLFNTSGNNCIISGYNIASGYGYFDGYMAEYYVIDGQALTPSDFGETDAVTGRWKPKVYSGTYGATGFYLNFADNSGVTATTLGKDSSGNGNNWTPNNFSVTSGVGNDSFVDSPTNYGALTHTFSDDTYQISRSLRFNSPDNAFLNRTPSSATSRNIWTFSGWVKRGNLNSNYTIFSAGVSAVTRIAFEANAAANGDSLRVFDWDGAAFNGHKITNLLFRDPSVWNHIVVAWDTTQAAADRIKIYVNGSQITSFSTDVNAGTGNTSVNNNALHRIGQRSDASSGSFDGYLTDVYLIDGQALTPDSFGVRDANTYTWKPKAYTGTYGTNGFYLNFSDNSGTTSTTLGKDQAGSNNWTPNNFSVTAGTGNDSFVDTPTYYGTDAGAGGEARGDYCTLNPVDIGQTSTLANGNLEFTTSSTTNYSICRGTIGVSSGKWYWEVLVNSSASANMLGVANVNAGLNSFVGQDANGWGYYSTGVKYNNNVSSSYGASFTTNDVIGVALDMDAGTLVFYKNNVSQGTAFTGLSGLIFPTVSDGSSASTASLICNFGQRPFTYTAPTGFKALRDYNRQLVPTGGVIRGNYATMNTLAASKPTLLNGALQTNAGNLGGINTFGMTTGKWFCEMDVVAAGSECSLGVSKGGTMNTYVGASADSWGYYSTNGNKYTGATSVAYGSSYTAGDTIGCAFDADLGLLSFYKNGVYQGIAYTGLTSGPYFFAMSGRTSTANNAYINFGQRPWIFGAPAGFRPVCTTSIPQPTIQKASSAMDVVTYTGNGSARSITGLGFSPDLVWIKGRSGATDHAIYDSVRGVQLDLGSNLTTDETTQAQGVTAFNSDGFSIGTLAKLNTNTSTYVAWAWDRAAIDGLDIVSYTGNGANRTIAHNLGVAPRMIIIKARTTAGTDQGWPVYHSSLANTQYLLLNSTAAAATGADYWNSTTPTASVFSLGTNAAVNANNDTYIAYLFAEVEGFSMFGSYTGNAAADGPFVWCGFRPRWVMVKSSAGTGYAWIIHDTARNPNNVADLKLVPNNSQIENGSSVGGTTFNTMDILSNGFKLRSTNVDTNQSAGFIFAAFAESPFKYSRAR